MKQIERKKINWKSGSGSTYLGVVMMLVAFTFIIVSLNLNRLYFMGVKTQVVIDAVVDGAAIAGSSEFGFDESAMQNAANDLVNYNQIAGVNTDYTLNVEDEYDLRGNPTGNKIISGSLNLTEKYYMPQYLSLADRFQTSRSAIVHVTVKTTSDGWIQSSYYHTPHATLPFYSTSEGHRNPAYVSWFIENYLNPQHNSIYKPSITTTHGHEFLFDYLKCMGLDNNTPRTLLFWRFYLFSAERDGWTRYPIQATRDIQQAANEGKAVIITQVTNDGETAIYVVVPETTMPQEGCVATATVGVENWNYKYINLSELKENSRSIIITVHD